MKGVRQPLAATSWARGGPRRFGAADRRRDPVDQRQGFFERTFVEHERAFLGFELHELSSAVSQVPLGSLLIKRRMNFDEQRVATLLLESADKTRQDEEHIEMLIKQISRNMRTVRELQNKAHAETVESSL